MPTLVHDRHQYLPVCRTEAQRRWDLKSGASHNLVTDIIVQVTLPGNFLHHQLIEDDAERVRIALVPANMHLLGQSVVLSVHVAKQLRGHPSQGTNRRVLVVACVRLAHGT